MHRLNLPWTVATLLSVCLLAPQFTAALRAADGEEVEGIAALVELLAEVDDPSLQQDLLVGMHDALRGRRNVPMPGKWPAAYKLLSSSANAVVREKADVLALIFGDPKAIGDLKKVVHNAKAGSEERRRALQALIDARVPQLAAELQELLDEPILRAAAIRGLAAYDHAGTPAAILSRYSLLSAAEKQDAVSTLSSRPAYALALLDAVEAGKVARSDLSVFTVRQLHEFGDERLDERVRTVWGTIRPTAKDKAELLARYKQLLTPEFRKQASLPNGRLVFNKTCTQCHRLFDAGGNVGPDLTGSNRANLDYILENVLDPSAVIGRDYQLRTIVTLDGRLISGIIREQTPTTLVVQTVNERVVLAREDVEEIVVSPVSMMPEGVFEQLTPEEVRDLIAYLAAPGQVPLPEQSE